MLGSSSKTSVETELPPELAERGWRVEIVNQANGEPISVRIPLTSSEFLHPKEGCHLPNSTFHDDTTGSAKDMLTRRYRNRSNVGVFRDLLIKWDITGLDDHSPDIAVVFGVRNPAQNRTRFIVADEGVRPVFILEVVSPRYRREDRETKVVDYALAKVQEYMIVDRRNYRGQILDEVLGYRLVSGHYQPLTPDQEGRVFFQTVGLWMSLREGQLIMEDAATGTRLKTSGELDAENEDLKAQLEALKTQLEARES